MAPKDYAFIEFTDEFKAGNALGELNGFQIEDTTLKISYAKKWSLLKYKIKLRSIKYILMLIINNISISQYVLNIY